MLALGLILFAPFTAFGQACSVDVEPSLDLNSKDSIPFFDFGNVRALVFNGPEIDPAVIQPGDCAVQLLAIQSATCPGQAQCSPLIVIHDGEPGTGNLLSFAEIPGVSRPHNVNTVAFDDTLFGVCLAQGYPTTNTQCVVITTITHRSISLSAAEVRNFQSIVTLLIDLF